MGAYLSKNEGIQSSFFDGLCIASKQSASHQGTGFLITNTLGLEIISIQSFLISRSVLQKFSSSKFDISIVKFSNFFFCFSLEL
ncbi:unnamed protein product [Parnassius mnemosyne]|uniref:Uncharacterized protein n=1 Tax=Parnassius mnemosyne TaxID=213953 RepID=A0AAV1KP21_9NEOP